MTSKAAGSAPREQKPPVAAEFASKDDVKASGTSGNDELTNSSSAGSAHPFSKKDKALKVFPATTKQEVPQPACQAQLNGRESASSPGRTSPHATP